MNDGQFSYRTGAISFRIDLLPILRRKHFPRNLASHSDELVILTVPNDASKVIKREIQHTPLSDALYWEFDLDQEPQQYVEWLTDKLSGDFKRVRSSGDCLLFAKGIDGDTESIAVRINRGHQKLHVRVDVKVVAD